VCSALIQPIVFSPGLPRRNDLLRQDELEPPFCRRTLHCKWAREECLLQPEEVVVLSIGVLAKTGDVGIADDSIAAAAEDDDYFVDGFAGGRGVEDAAGNGGSGGKGGLRSFTRVEVGVKEDLEVAGVFATHGCGNEGE